MLDAYKELTPVIYGENAIKHLACNKKINGMCFHMHWHDRMELMRVVSGQLVLHLGEEQVTVLPGQVAIITPRTMHCGFSGESGVLYHTIMFDVEKFCNTTIASDKYLVPVCKSEAGFVPVACHPKVTEAVDRLLEVLSDNESRNPLFAIGAVYEIIGALHEYCAGETKLIHRVDDSFKSVLEYVNSHYTERITAKDVSRMFGYNETYFCRRFKALTGITVMKYIQILRMELAQKLLRNSKDEIGNIAWKCGFSDISYFSNCFKKHFGMTPTEFRETGQSRN